MKGRLYAFICAILYRQILVSQGVLEVIPYKYQETAKFLQSQKLYADF